jgi:TolB protein
MAPPLTHGSRTGPIPRLARLLAVLMPLLPLSIAATPAHAAFPGANGRIVFDTADNPDGSQIYTANPDGSDLQQLTHLRDGAAAFMPRWSAGGGRIAYVSNATGNDELWTMRADGAGKRQITDEPGVGHYWPTWTPAGGIVFQRCDFTTFGSCSISAVRRDGSHLRTIVGGHWHPGAPAVSPDGTWIAFVSDKGGYDSRLWLVHPDGSDSHVVGDLAVLTPDRPDWAPDGSMLTFTGDRHNGKVFVISPDGTGLQVVTPIDTGRILGSFAPDGTAMVAVDLGLCDCSRSLVVTDTDGVATGTVTSDPYVTFSDWGVAA